MNAGLSVTLPDADILSKAVVANADAGGNDKTAIDITPDEKHDNRPKGEGIVVKGR